MELQQNLKLIPRMLMQTVRLQYICKEDGIRNIKGEQKNKQTIFQIFGDTIILR